MLYFVHMEKQTAFCSGNVGSDVVTADDNGYLLLKGVVSRSNKDCGTQGSFVAHSRLSLSVGVRIKR